MIEVFNRTGPQNLGGAQFWTLKIPYNLTCQFEQLWRLDYGANIDINGATRFELRIYNASKCDCGRGSAPDPAGGGLRGWLTTLPRPFSWFKVAAGGKENKRKGGNGKREIRAYRGTGMEGKGKGSWNRVADLLRPVLRAQLTGGLSLPEGDFFNFFSTFSN